MNANLEPSPAPPTGLEVLTILEQRANQVIEQLRQRAFAPGGLKRHDRRYSIGEAEAMVGRSSQTIRDAEKDGRLPQPAKDSRNRRVGYTLPEINAMRRVFNTLPRRGPDDEAVRVAFSNFKGGVGKSTLCVHAAQYMAQSGWRVLVVDADPQATTTSLFGLNPDTDLDESDTLYPFLRGELDSIRPLIRRSYFDQIDLLPANLGLYNCEYSLAGEAARGGGTAVFSRLRSGLDSAQDDYDMIFIDPPPALGMISLSVLQAANALVVPIRPATIDFGSTAHFFTMLSSVLEDMRQQGLAAAYKFVNVVINDMDEGKSTHRDIRDMMQNLFGNLVFSTVMKDSAEIDNAGGRLMTVYDLNEPLTSRETHLRCLKYLDQLNRELELRIRSTWPSHIKQLRQEGVL
jgi:chromosome partitioning protein